MKFLLSGSAFFLLIFLATLEGGLSSCTKDKTIYDTVTITRHDTTTLIDKDTVTIRDTIIHTDTLVVPDSVLTVGILTAHPWKIQELRGVMQGTIVYYLRGSGTNVINYDDEYLQFNADKTGSYKDGNGAIRVITWDFANAENTKLTFVIYNSPATFTITWEHIRYRNNSLFYDEYYIDGNNGNNWHGQGIRIPK